jgi:peptidoglycan hydrolase-like protein with peptidoglycan-binding domain
MNNLGTTVFSELNRGGTRDMVQAVRLLEEIVDDASDLLLEADDEDLTAIHADRSRSLRDPYAAAEASGFDVITRDEYVAWVKRSLNRRYRKRLFVDGTKSPKYRKLVKRFQGDVGLPETGEVDKATQNVLIYANEQSYPYMQWVQRALEKVGIFTDPPRGTPGGSTGSHKSYGLRLGIKAFQGRFSALSNDGFVGAKTEKLLMKECGCRPPGDVKPPPPYTPKPDKRNWNLYLHNRLKRAAEWLDEMGTSWYPAETCLIAKLLKKGTDDTFYDGGAVTDFLDAPLADAELRGDSLREVLISDLKRNSMKIRSGTPRQQNGRFVKRVRWYREKMSRGINIAAYRNSFFGYQAQVKHLKRTLMRLSTKKRSLYSCPYFRSLINDA